VGSDGTRYLLGDIFGNLLLLAIEGVNGRYVSYVIVLKT
jgi:hypothetical protein